ncbi:MAG: ligase-associated DNA damage response exonuclease [Bacteroidota bacterium]
MALLTFTEKGIYCERADVFIDPSQPVHRAIVTHAHSDHARPGSNHYLAQQQNESILRLRLGEEISLETIDYGDSVTINGVTFSFHPAGHIWGSSQVRAEYKGEIWVVSGDYKLEDDGFSTPFEAVPCHHFITESTFALPVFKWQPQHEVMQEINAWWQANAEEGKTSILCAYALGKAQRILHNVDESIGPIYVHGAVANVNEALVASGAKIKSTIYAGPEVDKKDYPGSLVVTPSSPLGTSWMNKFYPYEVATVSGWMNIRGIKRRRNAGRGFVMSDHADWDGLNTAVRATGAQRVLVTHGYVDAYARWLTQTGLKAESIQSLSIREDTESA